MVGGHQRYKILKACGDVEAVVSFADLDVQQEQLSLVNGVKRHLPEDDFDVSRAFEQIKEHETRRGDVWQHEWHRLVCGDATNEGDIALLMDGTEAALIVMDSPYNIAVKSDSERLAAEGRSSIMNDDIPEEDFAGFLHAGFQQYGVGGISRRRKQVRPSDAEAVANVGHSD